ncbi:hypothetical protein BN381_210039 [Candidatus Microthrix parvicella RN1]|uniref:Uncharacterized protein n=1 Tax=Candidatus Neomicrothrix parvicella RN1 TaxID=1229780 RepID=R4YXY3_9ACTN|nr:hypothetical protein BN381_210039 [Candidatus Microthrix parvicella RN1]
MSVCSAMRVRSLCQIGEWGRNNLLGSSPAPSFAAQLRGRSPQHPEVPMLTSNGASQTN